MVPIPGATRSAPLGPVPSAWGLDLGLRRGSGLEVLLRLQSFVPRPVVVVLTNYPHEEYRRQCLALGADAFLDKSLEFEQVVDALRAAARAPEARQVVSRPAPLDQVLGFGPAV